MRIDSKVEKKLKTTLQMSRCSGDYDYFRLTIEDKASGLVILEVDLDSSALGDLISNRYTEPQPARYFASQNIGKKHECITYKVELAKLHGIFESYEEKQRARDMKHLYDYAEEQNPGWTADRDAHNSHKKTRDTYSVTLRRYVSQE